MNSRATLNHLPSELNWHSAFRFPFQSEAARREIVIGGLLFLLLPPFGWIVNLGNRLNVVQRLYRGEDPLFTEFSPFLPCFVRGCISAGTIISYLTPGLMLITASNLTYLGGGSSALVTALVTLGVLLLALGMFALPGCMVIYACEDDPATLLRPWNAIRRGHLRGRIYYKAWAVALCAIALSVLSAVFFILPFFFLSVWAWQVAGYAFTVGIYAPVDTLHRHGTVLG